MALAYPNDRDGGSERTAAIKLITRKIEMAKRDGDTARIAKYEAELVDAKDAAKPLPGRTLIS